MNNNNKKINNTEANQSCLWQQVSAFYLCHLFCLLRSHLLTSPLGRHLWRHLFPISSTFPSPLACFTWPVFMLLPTLSSPNSSSLLTQPSPNLIHPLSPVLPRPSCAPQPRTLLQSSPLYSFCFALLHVTPSAWPVLPYSASLSPHPFAWLTPTYLDFSSSGYPGSPSISTMAWVRGHFSVHL